MKIDLEYSNEDFTRVLIEPVFMPCNQILFENSNGEYGLQSKSIPGNGPFMVRTNYGWDHDEKLILIRNPNYTGENAPIPSGINFSINNSNTNIIEKVEKNKLDAGSLTSEFIDKAKDQEYNLTSFNDVIWGLSFNMSNNILKNLNIRKSFIQSLSRDNLLSSIPKNSIIANDIILNSATINGKNYRELAKQNLYLPYNSDAKDFLKLGLKELKLSELPITTILCTDDEKTKIMVGNMLEIWSKQLGIYFNMHPLPKKELMMALNSGDYQLAISPIQSTDNNVFDSLNKFTSNNKYNIWNMKDSNYDLKLKNLPDNYNKQLNLAIESEIYLNNMAVFYPLYCQERFFFSAPNVKGIIFHQYGGRVDFIKTLKY